MACEKSKKTISKQQQQQKPHTQKDGAQIHNTLSMQCPNPGEESCTGLRCTISVKGKIHGSGIFIAWMWFNNTRLIGI